jgi:hypothetical protein
MTARAARQCSCLRSGRVAGVRSGEARRENSKAMNRTGVIVMWTWVSVFGIMLFFNASQLSRRHHAWITTFRKRNPRLSQPPTVQARELNEATMTWLFRILGAFFAMLAVFALVRFRLGE